MQGFLDCTFPSDPNDLVWFNEQESEFEKRRKMERRHFGYNANDYDSESSEDKNEWVKRYKPPLMPVDKNVVIKSILKVNEIAKTESEKVEDIVGNDGNNKNNYNNNIENQNYINNITNENNNYNNNFEHDDDLLHIINPRNNINNNYNNNRYKSNNVNNNNKKFNKYNNNNSNNNNFNNKNNNLNGNNNNNYSNSNSNYIQSKSEREEYARRSNSNNFNHSRDDDNRNYFNNSSRDSNNFKTNFNNYSNNLRNYSNNNSRDSNSYKNNFNNQSNNNSKNHSSNSSFKSNSIVSKNSRKHSNENQFDNNRHDKSNKISRFDKVNKREGKTLYWDFNRGCVTDIPQPRITFYDNENQSEQPSIVSSKFEQNHHNNNIATHKFLQSNVQSLQPHFTIQSTSSSISSKPKTNSSHNHNDNLSIDKPTLNKRKKSSNDNILEQNLVGTGMTVYDIFEKVYEIFKAKKAERESRVVVDRNVVDVEVVDSEIVDVVNDALLNKKDCYLFQFSAIHKLLLEMVSSNLMEFRQAIGGNENCESLTKKLDQLLENSDIEEEISEYDDSSEGQSVSVESIKKEIEMSNSSIHASEQSNDEDSVSSIVSCVKKNEIMSMRQLNYELQMDKLANSQLNDKIMDKKNMDLRCQQYPPRFDGNGKDIKMERRKLREQEISRLPPDQQIWEYIEKNENHDQLIEDKVDKTSTIEIPKPLTKNQKKKQSMKRNRHKHLKGLQVFPDKETEERFKLIAEKEVIPPLAALIPGTFTKNQKKQLSMKRNRHKHLKGPQIFPDRETELNCRRIEDSNRLKNVMNENLKMTSEDNSDNELVIDVRKVIPIYEDQTLVDGVSTRTETLNTFTGTIPKNLMMQTRLLNIIWTSIVTISMNRILERIVRKSSTQLQLKMVRKLTIMGIWMKSLQ